MTAYLVLLIVSLFANTMSAFAGGGSGLVQLPALIVLGLPFAEALATHKMANFALGLGSIARNLKTGLIEWKFAAFIIASGLLGTILGAYIIIHIPDHIAKPTLALLTISLGVYSFFKKDMGQTLEEKNRTLAGFIIGGLVLFIIGVFNGSLSSGSGLFVTLWLILWFGLDYKLAVIYTLALVGFFWNLSGGLTLYFLGEDIKWDWIPILWIGSFAGGWLGAHLGHLKGNVWIKRAFVIVTIASGISLLLK